MTPTAVPKPPVQKTRLLCKMYCPVNISRKRAVKSPAAVTVRIVLVWSIVKARCSRRYRMWMAKKVESAALTTDRPMAILNDEGCIINCTCLIDRNLKNLKVKIESYYVVLSVLSIFFGNINYFTFILCVDYGALI